jgi:hypothetical protein
LEMLSQNIFLIKIQIKFLSPSNKSALAAKT